MYAACPGIVSVLAENRVWEERGDHELTFVATR